MGICIWKGVRFLSKQDQLQPHFHSKARELSTQLSNALLGHILNVLSGTTSSPNSVQEWLIVLKLYDYNQNRYNLETILNWLTFLVYLKYWKVSQFYEAKDRLFKGWTELPPWYPVVFIEWPHLVLILENTGQLPNPIRTVFHY